MKIEVTKAELVDKPVIENLLQLYQYDFSEIMEDGVLGGDALYHFVSLDGYWEEPDRHAFLVRVDAELAGFALIVERSHLTGARGTTYMDEFLIMRKYRRAGVGKQVAARLFDLFPGRWEVGEVAPNVAAQAFWRSVIGDYTGGQFEERVLDEERWRGPMQFFQAPAGR